MKSAAELRQDAQTIWRAGLDAVRSESLMRDAVQRDGDRLLICGQPVSLAEIGRIAVVGAGKAGAGMAAALEEILGPDLVRDKVVGWINVPADCVRPLQKIHLHPARPAGVNEPTEAGVEGAGRILEIVESLEPHDLCLVLLSGGGSALLPAPIPAISLADKQAVTRFLMSSGATIDELNSVRKRLSRIKGGGLARRIRAKRTIALIISDVVGDPLDVIASGPTTADSTTDLQALMILQKYKAEPPRVPQAVLDYLAEAAQSVVDSPGELENVSNYVIGNNQRALDAAAEKARSLGYAVHTLGSGNRGDANEEGRRLAELCLNIRDSQSPLAPPACVLSGGEPVVQLAETDRPRRGGRNQQLVLAALASLRPQGAERIALLSGGTDGEDGPTDAAGAFFDEEILQTAQAQNLDPAPYLAINDSYTFFEQCGGLLKTGPTHTNVMDLRVALVDG